MNVRVEMLFESPDEGAWTEMESLGRHVTNAPGGVHVFAPENAAPGWLAVEFTMTTEAQYKAVEKVEHAVGLCAWMGSDPVIYFPKPPHGANARHRKRNI